MQATFRKVDGMLDYTNGGTAVVCGQVVVVGSIVGIVNGLQGIAASQKGTLAIDGHADFVKATGALSAGDSVYWDADGDPVDGTAGTGAATGTATGNTLIGVVETAALSGDTTVRVVMTSAQRTTTIAGSVTADDISGSDATLAIAGLGAAQGGLVSMTGGTSSTAGNAGGAVSLVGGTPGVTGVGGAASVAGGIGGATSGTGGAVSVAGGAGTAGNANGGAVSVLGGNAHGSGTDGVLSLGTSNTSAITIGAAGIVTRVTGYEQVNGAAAVTATTGGATTGLIPAGASFVVVTSDSADKQISLPAATVGDRMRILVGATGCELISVTAADKVNDVTVGATNEAALTATNLYDCQYVATNTWVVIGYTKLGAVQAALVPDAM